ncbi:MAG: transposase, partial [Candidatus Omnitrophica bacterium]|nr:transposase [Candidatus Omnitrophota bacterium]
MLKKELDMAVKKKISRIVAERYCKARKKEKGRILDEFVKVFGYRRCYASWLLRMLGKGHVFYIDRKRYVVKGEKTSQKGIRKRPIVYGQEVVDALKKVWYILDMPCGKRLAPYLKEIVPILETKGELKISNEVKEKLIKISAASIDRLLKEERKRWRIKKRSYTKPGSLLKKQIPIKTFADWNENRPGFIEIDLVDHSGGLARGIYAQTLDATDVFCGWTETICVENKSQMKVFEGLRKIEKQFPFPIVGIDSDNGAEF